MGCRSSKFASSVAPSSGTNHNGSHNIINSNPDPDITNPSLTITQRRGVKDMSTLQIAELSDEQYLEDFFTSGPGSAVRSKSDVFQSAGSLGSRMIDSMSGSLLSVLQQNGQENMLACIFSSLREKLKNYAGRKAKNEEPWLYRGNVISQGLLDEANALEKEVAQMKLDPKLARKTGDLMDKILAIKLEAEDVMNKVREEIELVTEADALEAALEEQELITGGGDAIMWSLAREKLHNTPALMELRQTIVQEQKKEFAALAKGSQFMDLASLAIKEADYQQARKMLNEARESLSNCHETTPGVMDTANRLFDLEAKVSIWENNNK